MSDTATQNTVASMDEGWETWAGSDNTLGSIRLVEEVQEPAVLPGLARPWVLHAWPFKIYEIFTFTFKAFGKSLLSKSTYKEYIIKTQMKAEIRPGLTNGLMS